MTMRERFIDVTSALLDERTDLALVLAAISAAPFAERGVCERHPHRVIDVGIREQLLIGVGAGLALEGVRPIIHTYAPFLIERPFEQVKLDFGHQGVCAILVSIGASYDASGAGRTHQAPEDVALVSTLPGWTVCVPGHPDEVEAALRWACDQPGSVYIRLSEEENAEPHRTGDVEVIRAGSGSSPTVLAIGPVLDAVSEAVAGMNVTLLYTTCPVPLNGDAVSGAMKGDELIVVEPYQEGTSAAAVANALSDRPSRILSIGVPRVEMRHYGTREQHRKAYGLDAAGIRRRIAAVLDRHPGAHPRSASTL